MLRFGFTCRQVRKQAKTPFDNHFGKKAALDKAL